MIPRHLRSEQGVTLIEMLVATMVLAVGVLALAGASGTVNRMIGSGRANTLAVQVAVHRRAVRELDGAGDG